MKDPNAYCVVSCKILCRKGQEQFLINDLSDIGQKGTTTCLELRDEPATEASLAYAIQIDPDNPEYFEEE